jgi:hypothetical protein
MNKNAIITGILFLLVFIIGFGLGRMTDGGPADIAVGVQESVTGQNNADAPNAAQGTQGTTVNTNSLTDGQRQMIEALGIDADNITITPQMVACAEAKLGAARVEEIKNGATPSFSEGASLMACYR